MAKARHGGLYRSRSIGRLLSRHDTDELTIFATFSLELHLAIGLGEQGVVSAQPYVHARMKLSAALAHDDAARCDSLATVHFDTKAFTLGVAPVACTTACFLVSHCLNSS